MIYFLQEATGTDLAIKIGYTSSDAAAGRQRGCQTGNPREVVVLATMPGERADETALHQRFASARLVGEWFRPIPELIQFILGLRPPAPLPPLASLLPPTASSSFRPLTVYLAGKISRHDWRALIVERVTDPFRDVWDELDWEVAERAVFGAHHYAGPFFVGGRHAQHGFTEDGHGVGANPHAVASKTEFILRSSIANHHDESDCSSCQKCRGNGCYNTDGMPDGTCDAWIAIGPATASSPARSEVTAACAAAIRRSDLLFAWIDELDCYGTIAEIGFAAALGKMIWIAGSRRFRDMWFVYEQASRIEFSDRGPSFILEAWLKEYRTSLSGPGEAT